MIGREILFKPYKVDVVSGHLGENWQTYARDKHGQLLVLRGCQGKYSQLFRRYKQRRSISDTTNVIRLIPLKLANTKQGQIRIPFTLKRTLSGEQKVFINVNQSL